MKLIGNWKIVIGISTTLISACANEDYAKVSEQKLAKNPMYLKSCNFSEGDSFAKVKDFYGLKFDPPKSDSSAAYEYLLDQIGVWIFFDDEKRIDTLRFQKPFTGKFDEVGIGDNFQHMMEKRGEPDHKMPGLFYSESQPLSARLYYPSDSDFVRYDIDRNRIQVIFASECP